MAAGAVTIFSFVGTFIIALVIGLVMKTRVSEEAEVEGLDTAIHGESAYEFGPVGGGGGSYIASSLERRVSTHEAGNRRHQAVQAR